jgi:hypothetical protein
MAAAAGMLRPLACLFSGCKPANLQTHVLEPTMHHSTAYVDLLVVML